MHRDHSTVVSVFLVTTLVLVFVFAHLFFNKQSDPRLSTEEAAEIVADYTNGSIVDIDSLMYDYGFYPVYHEHDVCSWANAHSHIWLDVKDGRVTCVNNEAGGYWCYWADKAPEDQNYTVRYFDGTCTISTKALAALICAATDECGGFVSV